MNRKDSIELKIIMQQTRRDDQRTTRFNAIETTNNNVKAFFFQFVVVAILSFYTILNPSNGKENLEKLSQSQNVCSCFE